MKNTKLYLIIAAVAIAVIIMSVFMVQSSQNKAISLEEAVYTAESDIKVQEKRRVDLVYNLADCVMQYDEHESNTLTELANNMSNGNEVNDVTTAISAIAYSYPELKSNENYNKSVTAYNRYVKKFPSRIFLDLTGYDVINFARLDYNAPVDAPQNLFGE